MAVIGVHYRGGPRDGSLDAIEDPGPTLRLLDKTDPWIIHVYERHSYWGFASHREAIYQYRGTEGGQPAGIE